MGAGVLAFPTSTIPAVNVASVPQRSPLRYPGGKTWLVPHIRKWLTYAEPTDLLVEPFAGGGVVSLTAVMEHRAKRALMVELDRDVAAFWRAALEHSEALVDQVLGFQPTRAAVADMEAQAPADVLHHGFRTFVLNRTRRGGVLAPGASLTRNGENGAGILSRWYPDTMARRLRDIAQYADHLVFCEGDGVRVLEILVDRPGARFFIDPPYTAAGGKQAGNRLYAHNAVDHSRIFAALADSSADFLMTYDCSEEVATLTARHGFHGAIVEMKTGHHARIPELVITREKLFA